MRFETEPCCLDHLLSGNLNGSACLPPFGADYVANWPYTAGLLVKWVAFLGTLHWPAGGSDLGVGGVSSVEVLTLYELWAGERLVLEKAVHPYRRPGRPISVSAVPLGPGTDIWRSCRFIGALFRALSALPGGLGRSEGFPRTRITKRSCACDCGRGPVSVGAFFFLSSFLSFKKRKKRCFWRRGEK